MALPSAISFVRYPVEVPNEPDKKYTIRQMVTKEYKDVLTITNMKHPETFTKTFGKIIESCVVEPDNFNINKEKSYIIEYLFMMIYLLSIKPTIDLTVKCPYKVIEDIEITKINPETQEEETEILKEQEIDCDTEVNLSFHASDIKISRPEKDTFELGNGVILKLKFPTWEEYRKLEEESSSQMALIEKPEEELTEEEYQARLKLINKVVYNSVAEIWVNDELWEEPFTEEEFVAWLDQFPLTIYSDIVEFINQRPQVYIMQEITCPHCKREYVFNRFGLDNLLK